MKNRNKPRKILSILLSLVFTVFCSYVPVKADGFVLPWPTGLEAQATDTAITLSWDHMPGAVAYEVEINGIERQTVLEQVYSDQALISNATVTGVVYGGINQLSPDPGKVTYVHSNLTPNTLYIYRVRTLYAMGMSDWSPALKKSTLAIDDHGLSGQYYKDSSFSILNFKRTDHILDMDWKKDKSLNAAAGPFSVRWKGQIKPSRTDDYILHINTSGKAKVWINNKLMIDKTSVDQLQGHSGTVTLSNGKRYDIMIEYVGMSNQDIFRLLWSGKNGIQELIPNDCLFVPVAPFAPDNISAQPDSSSIKLLWNEAYGATSYEIEQNGKIIGKSEAATYTQENLLPDTQYRYRIRSKNIYGYSEWSEYFTAKTLSSENNIGLKGEYFSDRNLTDFVFARIDPEVNFNWMLWTPDLRIKTNQFSIRWSGQIKAKYSETYTFYTQTDDGVRLWVNGKLLIDKWREQQGTEWKGKIKLQAGKKYNIQMEYYQSDLFASAKLLWSSPSQKKEVIPQSQLYPSIVQPGVPQNITTVSDGDSITISWDPVDGADGYDVEINGSVFDNGHETSFTQNSLVANAQKVYRVRSKTDTDVSAWSAYVVGTTLSSIPENISATAGGNSINLSWDAVGGAISYDVEMDGNVVSNINSTNYIFSGLQSDSLHKFRVRANGSSGHGQWSGIYEKRTLLERPSNVNVIATSSSIVVSWNGVNGASEYEIEVDGQIVKVTPATSFEYAQLDSNTSHIFRVRAKNSHGVSEWSSESNGTTMAGIPENLSANATNNSIELNWREVGGAVGYDIESNGLVVGTSSVANYVYSGLTPNTNYSIRVRSRSISGTSEWSNAINIKTLPEKLNGIKLTTKSNEITVEWAPTEGAQGYAIEVDGQVIDLGNATKYVHSGLQPMTQHIYRVMTKTDDGGKWSDPIIGWTIFTAPGNLKAVPKGGNSINVTWDTVEGATYYELEVDQAVYSTITLNNFFLHEGLPYNSTHSYRVRAICGEEVSEWSEAVICNTSTDRPEKLEGVASSDSITLAWSEVKDAVGYELEIDGQVIDVGNALTYTHSGLNVGSVHTYRVRSKNASGVSDWSEALIKKTSGGIVAECQSGEEFNFILMIPYDKDQTQRTVTVTFDPTQVDVADLCAITTAIETNAGKIEGTNITITKFDPQNGVIEISIDGATTAIIDSIKFVMKVSGFVRIVYVVK